MTSPSAHVLLDANVARAATDPAHHDVTKACLRVAQVLGAKTGATGAAMTPLLQAEWRKHASPMMTRWLASMQSRGRIRREKDKPVRDLRRAIADHPHDAQRASLMKDVHITDAAIAYGLPVVSHDRAQAKLLAVVASEYPLAGRIQWVDPVVNPDAVAAWLEAGCATSDYCVAEPEAVSEAPEA